MGKATSTAVLGLMGALVLVAAYLPWVRFGPLFLRGFQGDGALFLAAAMLALVCTKACTSKRRSRATVGLALVGGLLAIAIPFATLLFLAVGDVVASSSAAAETVAAMLTTADRASQAVGGTITLPANLFALAFFRKAEIPAFVDRAQTPDGLLASLDTLAAGPKPGSGLILSLILGMVLLGLAGLVASGKTKGEPS